MGIRWTEEKKQSLAARYPNEDTDVLASEFGVSRKALIIQANKMGIKKPDSFKENWYLTMQKKKLEKKLNVQGAVRYISTGKLIIGDHMITHISSIHE